MALLDNRAEIATLVDLCLTYLNRMPATLTIDASGGLTDLTFAPTLDPATEQPIFDRIMKIARSNVVGITPSEWAAIENDIATCKTFLGLASPTNAQATAALKSLIRIVAAVVRQ